MLRDDAVDLMNYRSNQYLHLHLHNHRTFSPVVTLPLVSVIQRSAAAITSISVQKLASKDPPWLGLVPKPQPPMQPS